MPIFRRWTTTLLGLFILFVSAQQATAALPFAIWFYLAIFWVFVPQAPLVVEALRCNRDRGVLGFALSPHGGVNFLSRGQPDPDGSRDCVNYSALVTSGGTRCQKRP